MLSSVLHVHKYTCVPAAYTCTRTHIESLKKVRNYQSASLPRREGIKFLLMYSYTFNFKGLLNVGLLFSPFIQERTGLAI